MTIDTLSHQQLRFVDEYIVDLNGKQVAIRASYSPYTAQEQASRLLSKVQVQSAIQERFEARKARVEIDQDFVVEGLRENYNRAMQATPVFDRDGKETGEWRWSGSVANKALELLGRHLGMYTDKSMNPNYNVNLDGTDYAERFIGALNAKGE